jgi:hypothetical protein
MQNVKPGEGNASRPDFFESRLLSPPGVRKREPVQRIATWLKMRLSFPRNTRSPVNQCPEHVEKQSLYAVLGTAALSLCHGRGADPRERPSHPGVRLPPFRDRNGASETPLCARTDAMSEARDWECESALLQQATICCAT